MAKSKTKKPQPSPSARTVASPIPSPVAGKAAQRPRERRVPAPRPVIVPPREAEPPSPHWTESDPRFWWAAAAILIIGIILRQWKLADAPFHPDEAIHATYALALDTYNYDPVYHGPLLYHLAALVFHSGLGDNDFSARLVPSLLGIGTLALAIGPVRHYIGARAALWSTGLLAISPVMVTYSRRLIHDSLVATLTLGAILCFQAARENGSHTARGRLARIGVALLLTLFLATKANAFFVIAMLFAYWFAISWSTADADESLDSAWYQPWPWWVPLAALAVASIASVVALRDANVERNELFLKGVFVVVTMVVWEWMRRAPVATSAATADAATPDVGPVKPRSSILSDWSAAALALGISAVVFTFLFGHGIRWLQSPGNFALSLNEAWGSPPLIGSTEAPGAIRQMLTYWGGQQKAPRLPGPHDYYLVLMALYELPIMIAAIGGFIYASRKRTPFTDLLIWWALTSWLVYSLANEKVPWLMTHLILPFALLGGVWLARLRPRTTGVRWAFAAACILGFIYLGRGVWAANFERAADHHEPMIYAQTTEDFRDKYFAAQQKIAGLSGDIWVYKDKQWPMSWYLHYPQVRQVSPGRWRMVQWGAVPDPGRPLRLAISPEPAELVSLTSQGKISGEQYAQLAKLFNGSDGVEADFYVWPRASWPALRPDRWAKWWWDRHATMENGVLSEWSHSPAVITVFADK